MIGNQFEYASPESLGIPSAAVAAFLREMEECRFPLHSYILMRHGKIAAEGYVAPFTADRKHRMYSVSKSFTSVAVGMLITEGRLSLDDRVADFFPEYLPDHPSPYTLRATVRDLLRMATPNEENSYNWGDKDFVATFFNNPKDKHEPGTIFHYDTAGTTTLCGLVEKITGMPILDYMRPLLDALGISGDIWCIQTPEGRSWTGSGIMCTSRDLLRFGLFCLQKGQWNGRQWVDRQYMEEATSKQIDINTAHSGYVKDGYGYQFWMVREGGFACSGMGGQYAFMMPKEDVVMVTTADTQGIDNAEDATKRAFYRLLDSMTEKPLPEDEAGERLLREAVPKTLPGPVGQTVNPLAKRYSGVTYRFDPNLFGFLWMRADFDGDTCTLTYEKGSGVHQIPLGMGRWKEFAFPDAYAGKNVAVLDSHYQCLGMAAWASEGTLLGKVFSVDDYLGVINIQLTFKGDTLTVFMTKCAENFFGDYRGYLAGTRAEA